MGETLGILNAEISSFLIELVVKIDFFMGLDFQRGLSPNDFSSP